MKLLRDVRDDGIEPERRRGDARESEDVVGHDDVRLAHERVAEGDVDAERPAVDHAREAALRSKAEAVVAHPLVLDLGVIGVRLNFEQHAVTEVEATCLLEQLQHVAGRAHHAEVDVLGGSRPRETQLEDEPSLEHHGLAGDLSQPGEEAIEDEQLPATSEGDACGRRGPEPLLEGLLEGQGRRVLASSHRAAAVRPRLPSSARSRASSFAETSPRRRAWRIPCRTWSWATSASMQSRRVRKGAVTRTAE